MGTVSTKIDELQIRQGYSDDLPQINALDLWLANTLQELSQQEESIYAVKGRVKPIEGVLKKVSKKNAEEIRTAKAKNRLPRLIKNYAEVKDGIDDIVGARLLAYLSDSMESLHTLLTSFQRFELVSMTIHDQQNDRFYERFATELQVDYGKNRGIFDKRKRGKRKKVKFDVRLNPGGYAGFHYVFKPKPVDPWWSPSAIFQKFEIQLRTILQEAWSEVSHSVVYKPELETESREQELAMNMLSSVLRACDTAMSNVANVRPKPSTEARKKK